MLFRLFGDRVKKWITINEPWTLCTISYTVGAFAPGRCSDRQVCSKGNSTTEPYTVAHNLLNAHAAVVELYKNKYQRHQKGMIGITLNMDWFEPLKHTRLNIKASKRRHEFSLGWFMDPIVFGSYPRSMERFLGDRLPAFTSEQMKRLKGSYDFIGFNHYSSKYVEHIEPPIKSTGWFSDVHVRQTEYRYPNQQGLIGPQAYSSWLHSVPWGFRKALKWIRLRYGNPFLYITENGCDDPFVPNATFSDMTNDAFRTQYLSGYLTAMDQAIQEGSDIRGYFIWTLMDNFEWASGYSARFGLFYVNYSDPKRTRHPKSSAAFYSNYVKTHEYQVSAIVDRARRIRDEILSGRGEGAHSSPADDS